MVLALSLCEPVLRIARAHWGNSAETLPEPVSRSCWTSRCDRVSRLPLGVTVALVVFLVAIAALHGCHPAQAVHGRARSKEGAAVRQRLPRVGDAAGLACTAAFAISLTGGGQQASP